MCFGRSNIYSAWDKGANKVALLKNILAAARPLADEQPAEPLIRPHHLACNESCAITMEAASCHPVHTAQPLHWGDAAQVVDNLRRDCITLFRLSFLQPDRAGRILDFLCGAAVIQRAGLYRIASGTYLLTPAGVSVDEALLRQLEEAGLYPRESKTRQLRLA